MNLWLNLAVEINLHGDIQPLVDLHPDPGEYQPEPGWCSTLGRLSCSMNNSSGKLFSVNHKEFIILLRLSTEISADS